MTIKEKSTHKKLISAKEYGYHFSLEDPIWILDRSNKINITAVTSIINNDLKEGYLETLSYFAKTRSAGFTAGCHSSFLSFIKETKCSFIDKAAVINFKKSSKGLRNYLVTLRIFIKKWYELGYDGTDQDAIDTINSWRIPKAVIGKAVRSEDPKEGPLTDLELQSCNDAAIRAFEKGTISLSMLTMALLVSHTGRRPLQILSMKIRDIFKVVNNDNNNYFLINIPRIKQGVNFRESFRSFRITKELYDLVCKKAAESIEVTSNFFCRELTQEETKDIPLFISETSLKKIDKNDNIAEVLTTDKLHPYRGSLTEIIKKISESEKVISERTGQPLHINSRRFRYTLGSRAAREGYGEVVIAELLDHSTIHSAGIYVQNHVDFADRIDKTVGNDLLVISDAFKGQVKRKEEIEYEITPSVKIKSQSGEDTGSSQQCSSCSANVPFPCYTCMHFTPWLNGQHEKVYQYLISEKERIYNVTKDLNVTKSLDTTIIAVSQVINHCNNIRSLEKRINKNDK